METLYEHNDGNKYTLKLTEPIKDEIKTVTLEFNLDWSMQNEESNVKDIDFLHIGDEQDFPFDLKKSFKTIPCHIPNSIGRELFKVCLDYFSKVSLAPIHTTFTHHPGYLLTLVTYDAVIMNIEEVTAILRTVNEAIKNADIQSESVQAEQELVDDEDQVDESIIIDYEEDPELKALMKQPKKQEYLPMEGE